jgi:cytoskeleton protein RodZ
LGKSHDPAAEKPASPEQLGQQLRMAREASRLSMPSAAASLHLHPRVIAALEDGDFAQFEPVYVRGYLRNYARLLNLDAEPLIESYNLTQIASHPVVPPPVEQPRGSISARGLLLPLALVGLPLILWIVSNALHRYDATGSLPSRDGIVVPAQTGEVRLPSAPTATFSEIKTEDPPTNQARIEPQAAAKPAPAEAPTVPPPSASQSAAAAPPLPAANPAPPAPLPGQPPVGSGPDSVAIRLSASGWVAIRDQTGRRLVYESLPAGAERLLSGQAPFSVVLGNSPATRIELNGQPFTPPKVKAGTVTRFTMGGATPGRPTP